MTGWRRVRGLSGGGCEGEDVLAAGPPGGKNGGGGAASAEELLLGLDLLLPPQGETLPTISTLFKLRRALGSAADGQHGSRRTIKCMHEPECRDAVHTKEDDQNSRAAGPTFGPW